MRTVLLSIQALLSAPNPDDPLANDVAELWKSNETQAIKTGRLASTSLLTWPLHHSVIFLVKFVGIKTLIL